MNWLTLIHKMMTRSLQNSQMTSLVNQWHHLCTLWLYLRGQQWRGPNSCQYQDGYLLKLLLLLWTVSQWEEMFYTGHQIKATSSTLMYNQKKKESNFLVFMLTTGMSLTIISIVSSTHVHTSYPVSGSLLAAASNLLEFTNWRRNQLALLHQLKPNEI